jgi:hypothetical protein
LDALHGFKGRYNRTWGVQKDGHLTPAADRAALTAGSNVAA